MKVAVIGTGNVGVAIAADLSIQGHEVSLIKSSSTKSETYDRLLKNANHVWLKENGEYKGTYISRVSNMLCDIENAEVVIVTIQSIYHDELYKNICKYLRGEQVVLVICSYLSSFYLAKYCQELPSLAEATGPYLEGRVELEDKPNEVVFRVGCRLTNSPLSVFHEHRRKETMEKLKSLYVGLNDSLSVIESALLNPNLVIHTVGSVMSIPRIEYSDGNFCMYRESYSHKNTATLRVMFKLDEEKKNVLESLGGRRIDILEAGGFLKGMDSFYEYSESEDRAISPTSIRSRYITEDVSQGLVLLESIAIHLGIDVPVTTSLIDLAGAALGVDFRYEGRSIYSLGAAYFIDHLTGRKYGCQ
ncbi:MAG: NAD/NADP octopine/nopaline dehydrogenase family protein [Prevotella sp.]